MSISPLIEDDEKMFNQLKAQLDKYKLINLRARAYYEGTKRLDRYGTSIPPEYKAMNAVIGWPGTVVDVLEERLNWQGWYSEDKETDNKLAEIVADNKLLTESSLAHLDGLQFGSGFVSIGSRPEDDELETALVTVESSMRTTGIWDIEHRRLAAAATWRVDPDGQPLKAILYKPDETIRLIRSGVGAPWRIEDVDPHKLGRVPVVALPNRPSSSYRDGRSEITKPLRSYTDMGVRTLLGMEVNRDFYQTPQWYALGVKESDFQDSNGSPVPVWETVMSKMLAIERDENGDLPELGQFDPAAPGPYLDQIRGLSQLVASEAGIPGQYFGFEPTNPPSGDSVRALETRLIKRTERRQLTMGNGWDEVALLSIMIKEKIKAKDLPRIYSSWQDAATPTRNADADAAQKLVAGGILPAHSKVTWARVGLTPREMRQVEQELEKEKADAMVTALLGAGNGTGNVPTSAGNAGGANAASSAKTVSGAEPNGNVQRGSSPLDR